MKIPARRFGPRAVSSIRRKLRYGEEAEDTWHRPTGSRLRVCQSKRPPERAAVKNLNLELGAFSLSPTAHSSDSLPVQHQASEVGRVQTLNAAAWLAVIVVRHAEPELPLRAEQRNLEGTLMREHEDAEILEGR